MKVLMTGFDPFDEDTTNAAWEAVSRVKAPEGIQLEIRQLPTVFEKSIKTLEAAVRELAPDVVICVGQAGGRASITPERIAINLNDARIPDNEENQPSDTPVREGGPAAYFSTLPVKEMVNAIRMAGIPASLSHTAGTFVCNHVMYGLLDLCAREFPAMKAGFIHVPYLSRQAVSMAPGTPSMSLEDMVRGLEAALGVLV